MIFISYPSNGADFLSRTGDITRPRAGTYPKKALFWKPVRDCYHPVTSGLDSSVRTSGGFHEFFMSVRYSKLLGVRTKGIAILDVPQEQLDRWRTLFDRVYVGAWEVIEARSRGNETKATVVLERLAATALSVGAEVERFGARPAPQDSLPFDRRSDTEAGHRYIAALKQALNAAHDFDQERFEADAPASDAIQMLLGEAERQVYGPPGCDDLFLPVEPMTGPGQPDA